MGGGSSQWICQWVVTVKCSKTPFQLNLKIRKPFRLLAYKQIIENTLQESKEILIDDKVIQFQKPFLCCSQVHYICFIKP